MICSSIWTIRLILVIILTAFRLLHLPFSLSYPSHSINSSFRTELFIQSTRVVCAYSTFLAWGTFVLVNILELICLCVAYLSKSQVLKDYNIV